MKLLTSNEGVLVILNYNIIDFDAVNELKQFIQCNTNTVFLVLVNGITHGELISLQNIGFKNFVSKDANEDEILYAIEATSMGKKYYSDSVLDLLIDKTGKRQIVNEQVSLTQSEMEIVRLIAEGLTTKQIAAQRHLSFHTVMSHRKNIFRKLHVSNVSELMLNAIKAGWIDNIEYYI
jgi:DNA-binding NarL/FixJ family response regulator